MDGFIVLYIVGAVIHLLVSVCHALSSYENGDEEDARTGVRYIFGTPFWPVIWLIGLVTLIYQGWKFAWGKN